MAGATKSPRRTSVLIVDDAPNMRLTLSDILADEGYEVSTAETGEQAVEMFHQHAYDVILMDVRLPGLGGMEAFRRIQKEPTGSKVILMTAYNMDDIKRVALDAGAVAFLTKPLDIESVLKLISEVDHTAILVVEDEQRTAATLHHALRAKGYPVTVTSSPDHALELAEQIRFDVVFIDTKLPGMNGLELYLAIKELTPTATAVMITSNEREFEEMRREAVRRTAYTVLQKPLEINRVLGLLERIAGQRASAEIRKPPPDVP